MPDRTPFCILAMDAGLSAIAGDHLDRSLATAAATGFGSLLWRPDASLFDLDATPLAQVAEPCAAAGLRLILEIDPSRFPIDHPLVQSHPEAFSVRRSAVSDAPIDPRTPQAASGEARARLRSSEVADLLRAPLMERLGALCDQGVGGFWLSGADRSAPGLIADLIDGVRQQAADTLFFASAPGLSRDGARALATAGLDAMLSSSGWWDLRAAWLIEEYEALRSSVPLVSEVRLAQLQGADDPAVVSRALSAAAVVGAGLVVPLALADPDGEFGGEISNALEFARTAARFPGEMRRLSGSASAVTVLLRGDAQDMRQTRNGLLILINTSLQPQPAPDPTLILPMAGAEFARFELIDGSGDAFAPLSGGEVRLLTAARCKPIVAARKPGSKRAKDVGAQRAAACDRLVVEDVSPRVDGGDFAVKRVVGESVIVQAKLYADGHEQLAAELLWRPAGEESWRAVRMEQLPNDGWRAAFPLERLGGYEFAVEGWLDRFGGFRRDFRKKLEAGVAQPVDHAEGLALVEAAAARGGDVGDWPTRIAGAGGDSAALLLSPELAVAMDSADDRPHRIRSAVQRVDAERLAARFSSWYELFPRSITEDPSRHGTFIDVIGRLPAIREMGFDTLYFPPIHPIGRTHRKGPNNSLIAGPDDPGSPYAIGSTDGGHDAIHPELGSAEDFARLVAAAAEQGLEIALDFAIQASPDHPWLTEHPGWFAWRPDGSMKYAENPPKKYQDIVNVDFYGPDAVPGLWVALRDVILAWIGRGVKIFRVDNPHTKPLPFWEWMIRDVRTRHPETIFLAEAFTRPAMMYRLGKIGFSQSYTYFTWRDRKDELIEYITELTTTAPKEFYRPHFFVNTPDINPIFLQTSGRPGFRIRAVLAATLSGLFGVYSGFELCEAAPVPGKEEYLDSEKYIVKPRDWQAPGNIIADITLLNRLRRAHPALQTHLNTRFYTVQNDNIIYYAKPAPDGTDMILVMVSLDPHHPQEGDFEVPLWEFGLPDDGSIAVEDLAGGERFRWYGKFQHIRLDPTAPYRIWRIEAGDIA